MKRLLRIPNLSDAVRLAVSCLVPVFACTPAQAKQSATCAVLTFDAGPGIHTGQSGLLCNRYSVLLARSGMYRILPRYRVNQILFEKNFRRHAYRSPTQADMAAAKLLGVQYVVFGKVERTKESFTLTTFLAEVRTGRIINQVTSRYTGDFYAFLRFAPASNLKTLLGIDKIPAKSVREAGPPTGVRPSHVRRKPAVAVEPAKFGPRKPYLKESPGVLIRERLTALRDSTYNRFRAVASRPVPETLADHLQIGTRVTAFRLTDSRQAYGTIYKVEEDQNLAPLKVFAGWRFTPSLEVEMSWDSLKAKTKTTPSDGSDGSFVMEGFVISAAGRYPNDTRLTPYGGLGMALLSGSFDADGTWSNRDGHTQAFTVDDSVGYTIHAGCEARLPGRWSADFLMRYMKVEIDFRHSISVEPRPRDSVTFVMDNLVIGMGIRYAF